MSTTSNTVKSAGNLVYTTNGTAGQFLTSTGSNGTTWANSTVGTDPALTIKQTNPPELEVKGRLVLNGQDMEERLGNIEKVLQIPERDVKLEKKHPRLKKLYDQYVNELEKYRTWDRIKGEE